MPWPCGEDAARIRVHVKKAGSTRQASHGRARVPPSGPPRHSWRTPGTWHPAAVRAQVPAEPLPTPLFDATQTQTRMQSGKGGEGS
ncbi:hypothetical protein AcV5_006734 [Taiwanofungus camphoratus]|nr:hypothetical protein AcV5_006734 [Antrodia cinnamomea]